MADSKIDDGGLAFPVNDLVRRDANGKLFGEPVSSAGMSLRDYAAIHSDVPWGAVIETLRLLGNSKPTIGEIVEYRAKVKYAEADAMIAARKAGA